MRNILLVVFAILLVAAVFALGALVDWALFDAVLDCPPCPEFASPPISCVCNCCCETPTPCVMETPDPTPTPPIDEPTPTPRPTPTPQPPMCFQLLIHMPSTSAEQVYCCESSSCVQAHIRQHGDYCIPPINSEEC